MELTLQKNSSKTYIRSYTGISFIIGENEYKHNVIIDNSIKKWNIMKSDIFDTTKYDQILTLKPEIILLGCGSKQLLPPEDFIEYFTLHNIGIEVITTEAACKTFNILISEDRKVVAALIL